MDIILPDHRPEQLEKTFNAIYLYDHPLYSLMAEPTVLPWLLVIPKHPLTDPAYIEKLYGEIHRLIHALQQAGFGPHFNLAKLGNQNPHLHIHIIFRTEADEVWPNPVWCHEPLTRCHQMPLTFRKALGDYFS
ncbi:hypothetical protein MNBD_GAMMA03-2137 [hydrothermal vent metagenome]|uniref:HIT domain-containing protein n=1 Tax=hydrothermal vent metagenome TaxID=652676 RepID=A0A3B0WYI0_9ZZZZ